MRPVLAWIDKVQDDDGTEHCVYDLAFKPDGSELLVAADNKVLVYDGTDGTLLQALKGHKNLVYCVDFSHNGERFASGGADRAVIIWTEHHEGTLKYNHGEAIQCLAFAPNTTTLLSCSVNDFGIWTETNKTVAKQKVQHRICSCAWAPDGMYYALGLYNGTVSVRSAQSNDETSRFSCPGTEPIWKITFSPGRPDVSGRRRSSLVEPRGPDDTSMHSAYYVIVCGSWEQRMYFFDLDGNSLSTEVNLKYDPCALSYFSIGDFLLAGGSNKQLSLYSREGTFLGPICQLEDWIWTVATKPKSQFVVVGSQDGTLACYQLLFSTVHGLHKERYGYRENMTDVIVQDLSKDKRGSYCFRNDV